MKRPGKKRFAWKDVSPRAAKEEHPLRTVISDDAVEVLSGDEGPETREEINDEERQAVASPDSRQGEREEREQAIADAVSFAAIGMTTANRKETRRSRFRGKRVLKALSPRRFRASRTGKTFFGNDEFDTYERTLKKEEEDLGLNNWKEMVQEGKANSSRGSTEKVPNSNQEGDLTDALVSSLFTKRLHKKTLSLEERLRSLELHLERAASSGDDEYSAEEGGTVRTYKTGDTSAFYTIPKQDISRFEKIVTMNESDESFEHDSLDGFPDDPISSWLGSRYKNRDSEDAASQDTFHSSTRSNKSGSVGGTFSHDGTKSDGESYVTDDGTFGQRATFSMESQSGGGSYTETDSDTDGDTYTDTERGEETDFGSYTDGGEETDLGSFTDVGEDTDGGSFTDDGDLTDDGSSLNVGRTNTGTEVPSDAEPFSEIEESGDETDDGSGTDTDRSRDVFPYQNGRFLLLI